MSNSVISILHDTSLNYMHLLIGASHCEIDAKVLEEIGLKMHLHTHSEGFRNGLVRAFLAAEGVGFAQPLVSFGAT